MVSEYVTSGIHIKAQAATDLIHVQEWFSAYRGQTIGLDRERRVELGAPISGAGAVLVPVTMRSAREATPDLGGVVRALAGRHGAAPAVLVFEGRSPAQMADEDARFAAADLLEAISALAAGQELMTEVA